MFYYRLSRQNEIVPSLVHNLLIRVSDFIKLKKRTRAVVRSSYIRTWIFFSCSFFRFLSMLIRAILLANLTIMGLGPGLVDGQ